MMGQGFGNAVASRAVKLFLGAVVASLMAGFILAYLVLRTFI